MANVKKSLDDSQRSWLTAWWVEKWGVIVFLLQQALGFSAKEGLGMGWHEACRKQ
jgi:hypothetical protein